MPCIVETDSDIIDNQSETINKLSRNLCAVMNYIRNTTPPAQMDVIIKAIDEENKSELQSWWQKHLEDDKKRVLSEFSSRFTKSEQEIIKKHI